MIKIDIDTLTSSFIEYFEPLADDYYHYNYRLDQTLRSSLFSEIPRQTYKNMLTNVVKSYSSSLIDYAEFLTTRDKNTVKKDFNLSTIEDTEYFINYVSNNIKNVDSKILVEILFDVKIQDILKSPGHICVASVMEYLVRLKKDPKIEFVGSSRYKWFSI